MQNSIRSFIAIHLTNELKSLLSQVGAQIENRIPPRTVRWVRPAAMHLTLVFLGDTPTVKLDSIQQAISNAATAVPPITFNVGGLGCFPNYRRPRVLWVGVQEPASHLQQLKISLDRELDLLGFKAERRPFSPHLTLGRVNKQASREDAQKLGQVIEQATLHELGLATVAQVHLIQSDLRPSGPIYTTLYSAELGPR